MLYVLLDYSRRWLSEHGQWLGERGFYSPLAILDQIQFRALASAVLSFAIMIVFGRRVIAMLVRLKIGDAGLSDAEALQRHAASRANVPTMGGILIAGAILVSVLLLADLRHFFVQAGLMVFVAFAVLGGVDDWLKLTASRRGSKSRQGLYAWEKLVFQLAISALVSYFLFRQGGATKEELLHVLNLPGQKTWESPGNVSTSLFYLSVPLFVLFATLIVTGLSNAVNISDGMDGLAAGTSGIVSIGLVVLALIAGSQSASQYLLVPHIPMGDELAVFAGAMAGACFGFLWWNCSPASVFMGDTGALSLGAMAGYVAVITRQEFVVLAMCGVFLIEAGSVVLQVGYFKYTKGKRIFKVAPYHHHLHLSGWTEQQVVVRFWIITVLLVVLAMVSIKVR
ncbi:MAG: phospho-N-acetylmuramoyl-pentapeptide-transferase [Phycisphaeraceae bacterium]|nr:phospho-N-acetylmuramoyl-pentapeptide-transferase [Phycisphaeraceae bacterium]